MIKVLESKDKTGEAEEEFNVREILLLNKKSGLPVLSRVYGEATGKDPTLVAGLLAAIIQFAETIGNNLELNDIGIAEGSRIFVRSEANLVCLLIIDKFHVSMISNSNFLDLINEISTRVFESIHMMFSIPSLESMESLDDSIEAIDSLFQMQESFNPLDDINETSLANYPELGFIIDNIVFETSMMYSMSEDENIDETLSSIEVSDETYLSPTYSGTTKEIKKDKPKVKDIFSRLNQFWESNGED